MHDNSPPQNDSERSNRPVSLYDLVDPGDSDAVRDEVAHVARLAGFGGAIPELRSVHADVVRLFRGEFSGYSASSSQYHNLEHTCSVVLAAVRLLHGCVAAGIFPEPLSDRQGLLCVVAAYFHDAGMIRKEGDGGSGPAQMEGHEERSAALASRYLTTRGCAEAEREACANMIRCTNLALSPDEILGMPVMAKLLGCVVGSADLLAQFADVRYPQKLHLLFQEFVEAGCAVYASEQDLIAKTGTFYREVVCRRLDGGLRGLHQHMREHFRTRWGVDEDMYATSIARNLTIVERMGGR